VTIRTIRILFIAVILHVALIGTAWAEESAPQPDTPGLSPTAVARVDMDTITIGDPLKYTIELTAGKDVEVDPPAIEGDLDGFTVKDSGSEKSGIFGKKTTTFWYLLDTYETGSRTIPGPVIRYREKGAADWKEMALNEVEINVKSVLGDQQENADIKDIRGPVGFPTSLYIYILAGLAAVIVIYVIIKYILQRRKKAQLIVPPPRPAHEIAYEALMELQKKGYPEKGMIKEYYTELSDIVRRYIENRFGLRAPEMTTEEFIQGVRDSGQLDAGQKDLLREFLSRCDLVKFAKFGPEKDEIDGSHESARRFIDQTRSAGPVANGKEAVKA